MKTSWIGVTLLIFVTFGVRAQEKIENLVITWPEEYKWQIGSNQEDGKMHMMELVPGNETVDKWTIIGTMISIKGVKGVSMDAIMKLMYEQAKENAPKATVTLVEKDENAKNQWIIFKIEAPRFKDDKTPESQLYYVIQGESSLYTNFVAIKEKTLSPEFVTKWTAVFKASQLVYQ